MSELTRLVEQAHKDLSEKAQAKAAMLERARPHERAVIALIDECEATDSKIGEHVFAVLRAFNSPSEARELLPIIEDMWKDGRKVSLLDDSGNTKTVKPELPRTYVTTKNDLLRKWEAMAVQTATLRKSCERIALETGSPVAEVVSEHVPDGMLDISSRRYQGTEKRPGIAVKKFREDARKAERAYRAANKKTTGSKTGGTYPKAIQELCNAATKAIQSAHDRGVSLDTIREAVEFFDATLTDADALAEAQDREILAEAVAEAEVAVQPEAVNG